MCEVSQSSGIQQESRHSLPSGLLMEPEFPCKGQNLPHLLTRHPSSCGSAGKESTCNAGDLGLIPGLGKRPWRRERLPTPVFWPGGFHGLYSPWGHRESNMTERLSLHSLLKEQPGQLPLHSLSRSCKAQSWPLAPASCPWNSEGLYFQGEGATE